MPTPKIRPVGDRILVQYKNEKEQVRGGVIIPDSAREQSQEATIIALGTGAKTSTGTVVAFDVKVGDVVLVGKFTGAEVKLNGQTFTLVRQDDILGRLG